MRLLVLGALGPYPERMTAFTGDGHRLWHLSTEWVSDEARTVPWEALERLRPRCCPHLERACRAREWIARHEIDAVYSLLNVWDGSNAVTAALLRGGEAGAGRAPLQGAIPESGARMNAFCLEESQGVVLLNEESRRFFAGQYRLPERVACVDWRSAAGALTTGANFSPGSRPPTAGRTCSSPTWPRMTAAGTITARSSTRRRPPGRTSTSTDSSAACNATGQMTSEPAVADAYRASRTGTGRLHLHAPIAPTQGLSGRGPGTTCRLAA